MEHNNLKTISPYLFSNNKQRMSISLAYNQLDFEDKELTNNSWLVKRASPFAHTYNLKLLNLSHNEFKVAFEDWWVNGHENLDISHNNIQNLWTDEKALKDYRNVMKKGMKSVWISKNPINCGCENYLFMDFLLYSTRTKIVDLQHVRCPLWAKEACYMRFTILITLMTVVISIYTIILVVFIIYRKQINSIVKKRLSTFHRTNAQRKEKSYRILMDFCHQDEEFVNREMLSIMTTNESLQILTKVITDYRNSEFRMSKNFKRYVKDVKTRARVVVFSSNYLTETYGHIDIKKIHSEMLKAEKTIYIFADIGPDNSIYDFLEEQRDLRTTLKWNEENFWPKLYALLKSFVSSDELKKVEDTLIVPGDSLEPSKISLTNTP
nr:unnamed protein product [Spodoptera littoralis]